MEEAGVGVELAVEDPGDDGVGATNGLLLRLRHWWRTGLGLGLGLGLGFGAA